MNLTGNVLDSQVCSVQAILDLRAQNATTTRQQGIDFSASYAAPTTSLGDFMLSGTATYILLSKQTPIQGLPEVDTLGLINTVVSNSPVRWKGRAGVDWRKGVVSAGMNVNYIGSYYNNAPITILGVRQSPSTVPAWKTLDVHIGLDLDRQNSVSALKGLRLSMILDNVTNKNPPIVLSTIGVGGFDSGAFDGNNADPYGRRLTVALTKAF